MERERELLSAIVKAHTEFVAETDARKLFEGFLGAFLSLTGSEYGFIGEILRTDDGQPYLKTFSITNIAWNEETSKFYKENAPDGLEFYNLDTLFGHVMVTGETVIANDPARDTRGGGIPEGHPPLKAFLGLPIKSSGEILGMAGLANKEGGFTHGDVTFLEPLLLTCGNYIRLLWDEREALAAKGALQESEVRSQAILDSTLDAILTISDDGHIVSANKAASRMFGYEIEELVGQDVKLLMPEPHRTLHNSYIKNYLETGEAKVIGIGREAQAQRKDGSRFPIELAVTEFSSPGKHRFAGIIKDISTRKIVEARLEETRRQLHEANEDMLAILDESRMGVLMVSAESKIKFANKAMETISGKSKYDLLNEPWEKVLPITKEQRQKIRSLCNMEAVLRSRLPLNFETGEGQDIWTELQISDDPQESGGKILFFYDVTEIRRLRNQLGASAQRQIVGKSSEIKGLLANINKVAMGDWTVLIEGETGVGKELVAHAIHRTSPRKDGPFIAINCGGLTETLLTSQLFGHRRGAFTGATVDHEGFFEAAYGGTLFLDEIGELPLELQSKLLRVIESGEFERLGSSRTCNVDVRIIAATNRDLEAEIQKGRFREDLWYRLSVFPLTVPPLRQRKEDIPLLVSFFLKRFCKEMGKTITSVPKAIMDSLLAYPWPGNIRELKNIIERAVITTRGTTLELMCKFKLEKETAAPKPKKLADIEYQFILETLEKTSWKIEGPGGAARILGLKPSTLRYRMKKLGIQRP